jgi:diguanylate cyclase (GGDEF)-like protein
MIGGLAATLDLTFVALTYENPERQAPGADRAIAVACRADGKPTVATVPSMVGEPRFVLVEGVTHLAATHLTKLHPLPDDPVAKAYRAFPLEDGVGTCLGQISVFFADADPDPRVLEVIAIFARRVATDLHQARTTAELNRLAMTDPLTGIANRRALMDAAEREMRRARRFRDHLSVLLVDIDHFKAINDAAGHTAGDAILHQFAATATRTLRSIDIVGRIGGEEFAILLPGTPREGAMLTGEKIRAAARSIPMPAVMRTQQLTVSVGVADLGPGDASAMAFLGRADDAMYLAKRTGRDKVVAAPHPEEGGARSALN